MAERRWKRKRKKIELTMPRLASCACLLLIVLHFVIEDVHGAAIEDDYDDYNTNMPGEMSKI